MPLTTKGNKIMESMRKQYGDRAEQVFYASRNAGTITGVDPKSKAPHSLLKRFIPPKKKVV